MGRYLSPFKIYIPLALALIGIFSSGCSKTMQRQTAEVDRRVYENIQSLMGLSNGMSKGEVYSLAGVANYVEGYEWGSVWRYKIRKGENDSFLAKKDVELNYMPVVFDNTDRVMGYGQKFYDQTLKDLGAGQF
jgi:hypothetical protein